MNRRDFFTQGVTVISTKLLDQPVLSDLTSTVNKLKAQSKQLGLEVTEIRGSMKDYMIDVNQQIKALRVQQRGIIVSVVTLAILG